MSSAPSPLDERAEAAVPPILWMGALHDPSGYADEARAFLLALERSGQPAGARALRWTTAEAGLSGEQLDVVERAVRRGRTLSGERVLVQHLIPHEGMPVQATGPTIVRTMFETDRLPECWLGPILTLDAVWVPSAFNVATFAQGGVPEHRLRVLPGTLDFDLFDPARAEPGPIPERRGFCFLASFDFTDRKGWDILLDAWADAFDPDDDVCLVLKCLALHTTEAEAGARVEAHLAGRRSAPVLLDTRVLPMSELPGLYAGADAFVLPSRGEGWGRPYMEAMAMGLATIGSRFGGNLEFMDDTNSWLLDGTLVPVSEEAQRHSQYYRGHRWFDPDRDALVTALREVARGGDEVRTRAARARAGLLERFGHDVVAGRIAELATEAMERWRHERSRPIACVWRGDWGSQHSLAVVNDSIVRGLERGGELVRRILPAASQVDSEAVGIAQHWPPCFDAPSRGPFVLYQPWEFGAAPRIWVEEIRRTIDEVWALSEVNRQAFVASGVPEELVHVVPCGVDLDHFAPGGPMRDLGTSAGTVFLFVGGTIHRKGVDILLAAYERAFGAADDVLLVIKSFGRESFYRGMDADDEIARFARRPDTPRVLLVDEDVPHPEIPALYCAADVLVQPYRAEGFCLPALEALACGVPVIVTAGGPTDEFATDASAWRIPSVRVPIPRSALSAELELAGDGFLLEPDIDALVAALRDAADPAARAPRAAAARADAERFPWDRAASAVRDRLAALAGRTPIRLVAPADVPDRRGTLFAVIPDWSRPDTWVPAVVAYAEAFGPGDDTTLALAAGDPDAAGALVERELAAAGIDMAGLADIVLAEGLSDPTALELAAAAVVCPNGYRPLRAASILPPDPSALRALAGAQ